jgi:hypothetical protein
MHGGIPKIIWKVFNTVDETIVFAFLINRVANILTQWMSSQQRTFISSWQNLLSSIRYSWQCSNKASSTIFDHCIQILQSHGGNVYEIKTNKIRKRAATMTFQVSYTTPLKQRVSGMTMTIWIEIQEDDGNDEYDDPEDHLVYELSRLVPSQRFMPEMKEANLISPVVLREVEL